MSKLISLLTLFFGTVTFASSDPYLGYGFTRKEASTEAQKKLEEDQCQLVSMRVINHRPFGYKAIATVKNCQKDSRLF